MTRHIVEETQDLLTELESAFGSMERLETTVDNLGPSASYNASLFFGMNMAADALWFTGSAIVLGIVYAVVHWGFNRRYRDSWEAHLSRERDRLNRIGQILENIDVEQIKLTHTQEKTQRLLRNLRTLVEQYEFDTENLSDQIGKSYVNVLKISGDIATTDESDSDFLETDSASEKEIENALGLTEEDKKQLSIAFISQFLTEAQYQKYQQLIELITSTEIEDSPAPAINVNVEALEKEKEKLQKIMNTFSISGYGFNIVLSYALAYWLVMYFSTTAFVGAALTTPVTWALFALVFPIVYLIYKEFKTYKERITEKDIDSFDDKEKKKAEMQRRAERLNFRYGWAFVGLIVMLSLIFILPTLGLSILASALIGIGSFIAIFGGSLVVGAFINQHVEAVREERKGSLLESLPERKSKAAARRRELDAIALVAYELELQSRLKAQQALFNISVVDEKNQSKTPTIVQQVVDVEEETSQKPKNRIVSFAEKTRLALSLILSFLAGYAFGNMLFMVAADFLANFTSIFTGPWFYIATGVFGVILAGLFVKQTYCSEKSHQIDLDILAAKGNSSEKQKTLEELENKIAQIKLKLNAIELEKQKLVAQIDPNSIDSIRLENIKALKPDFHFVHPVRQEGLTKRKILFGVKAALQILVTVSTAILFSRMVLLGGFVKLAPAAAAGGSLMILGSSISVVGLIVLGLALAVLLVKTVHDIYLAAQREKEKEAIERIDFDIKCKETEYHYLSEQEKLIEGANVHLKSLSKVENTESHDFYSHPKEDKALTKSKTSEDTDTESDEETPKETL